jgi:hypothetical protein
VARSSNGRVTHFGCSTDYRITKTNNQEIYAVLKRGFTSKFGPPDAVRTIPVRTRAGIEYEAEEVWWKDKAGNVLNLYSMEDRIDRGGFFVISADEMEKAANEVKRRDESRKF